ncbi:Long-chain-fatty-acid--CoA ligase [Patulibacter medicamentivorans]|uniref:Long-chain-fatty-acid--CoA ligase n=1 Tax=Patulibacter medicamentivorans TaxID=1097667 RepID=H0E953_9ACTN|nr:AMP-binding protein [Patulibacter medicamentivorans]EHN09791.1 Long-chain-fatty-acid--CoA ligase [Patulibacter medicamentivorans]
MPLVDKLPASARRAGLEVRGLRALLKAGMLGAESPQRLRQIARALSDFGSFGSATKIAALRHGALPAIADDRGEVTFADFDAQVDQLANALRAKGIGPGSKIGILCRNHRAPLLVAFAGVRAGATVVYLNTAFSARQAKEVAEREGVELLFHDEELADAVAGVELALGAVACATRPGVEDPLDALIASGASGAPPAPPSSGRIVLLTSGTTGTPKGAPREDPRGFIGPGAVLERMPMRAREATVIGPPLFHGTGLLIALLSLGLGSKLVLRPRFDAAQFLDDVEAHRATTVCVVPIMLQRVLALDPDEVRARDLSSLRVAFSAGSQLPAEVAARATELLGDVIYNLYGSTEVALATLATPSDVREAPTSVGRPLFGSRVRILDEHGDDVPKGATGRIFVGTGMPFEGYTGGGNKEIIDGLLSSGDVGHFDAEGRLYVDGRDDEMIVSGGENVFPREVEELLISHPAIVDAAAIGVDDADFGQRLRAFVVLGDGQALGPEEVQAFVKDNLARYKAPRDVVFLEQLPRNPTGKVLKRELAQIEQA